MSEAYTPGLKRKEMCLVRNIRRLPLPGEILVKIGEKVSANTVVARIHIPGEFKSLNAADILKIVLTRRKDGTMSCDLNRYMLKREGDSVNEGEIIAHREILFGMIKYVCKSPIKGIITYISNDTGQIILRQPPKPFEIKAYIPGIVKEIIPNKAVAIETPAAFIQGIFGIGEERNGELMIVAKSPKDILEADAITADCAGKIIIGGSLVSTQGLIKAVEVGAEGIVVGGIMDKNLIDFVGHEIGVAITGREEVGLTLLVTEGFGEMQMAEKTFNILKKFDGKPASINGATQIRAGVIRPEIIIPINDVKATELNQLVDDVDDYSAGLKPRTLIRIIRQPYFGALARVVSLPVKPQRVETQSYVRVLEAELEDGRRTLVPRANVEIIEE